MQTKSKLASKDKSEVAKFSKRTTRAQKRSAKPVKSQSLEEVKVQTKIRKP